MLHHLPSQLHILRAIDKRAVPEEITLDAYPAIHRAIRELRRSAVLPINVAASISDDGVQAI